MRKEDVAGRWQIVAWEQRYDDGRVTYPMGERLTGFIQYDDPNMFIIITNADRPNFVTGGQWNASDAEKAGAYRSCLCYAGTYDLSGDTVIHNVQQSLFPNWVGGQQKRKAALKDGRLVLTARLEDGTSEARTASLIWER